MSDGIKITGTYDRNAKGKYYRLVDFIFNYNRDNNKMEVHAQNKTLIGKNLECSVPIVTKWRNAYPRLSMCGQANIIELKSDTIYIK